MRQIPGWDEYYLNICKVVAERSKDVNTQIGCVIIGPNREIRSTGYNSFPRGIRDDVPERMERPAKYLWIEHAERNAIYNAARAGIPPEGCRMYVPWFPCADCATAIIQSGLTELIASEPDFSHPKWGEDFRVATDLLKAAQVPVRFMNVEAPVPSS